MVHLSPRITTVNRSAERRKRLKAARRPVIRRRFLRFSLRTVSLSAALAVMLYTFPPLLDAARAHPVVPASFLTAEERMAQKRAAREQSAKERAEREQTEQEQAEREQTEQERAERERTEQERAERERTEQERAADSQAERTPAYVPETDSVQENEPEPLPIPELVILPPPGSSEETEAVPGDAEAGPVDTEAVSDGAEAGPMEPPPTPEEPLPPPGEPPSADTEPDSPFLQPQVTASTFELTDIIEDSAVKSQYAVLMDAKTGEIIAERFSDTLINPASMTKVLTLLTAVECLTGPDGSWDLDSYTWNTAEISQYCWANDCSMAWFTVGEWVLVRDTLYGMILPSGADGALMLANYAAGSQEALVEKMNEKAREIGLSQGAHFENCVGLYGENHVCTVRDMAVIMKAAMDHPVCRTVLGKEVWTTSQTEEHPSGILLVNRFLRRIKNEDSGGLKVIGAKTGYVRQAGNCAVSMARRADGREFICVTAKGPGSNQVVRDHAALYRLFCG